MYLVQLADLIFNNKKTSHVGFSLIFDIRYPNILNVESRISKSKPILDCFQTDEDRNLSKTMAQ